jgi:ATP phosphoribosyltransferase regulatory subunit
MAAVDGVPRSTPARGRAGGFSDWLPGAAARRRALTEAFVDVFTSWGYELVATPLIEPLDTVAAGVGAARQAQLFRFMDSDGSLLALVGERTVSVARVVATQLHPAAFPLRLCYAGPVLRNAPVLDGRRRESMQAGCELIGHAGLAADAECIALAAAALERGGVHDVQIDVGHAGFIPGVLESAGLDDAARRQVLDALARRDLVAVESALEQTDVRDAERRLLLAFPTLRGGREMLETAAVGLAGTRARRALNDLAELWQLLEQHGVTPMVHLDLGAVRDWDYYTGPTFEVFSLDSGFPLGSGGRYDSLLERFGTPACATGFVLHVDRCNDVLTRRDGDARTATPVRVLWLDGARGIALTVARRLREGGVSAVCALDAAARADGVSGAVLCVPPDRVTWDVVEEKGEGGVDAVVRALTEAFA